MPILYDTTADAAITQGGGNIQLKYKWLHFGGPGPSATYNFPIRIMILDILAISATNQTARVSSTLDDLDIIPATDFTAGRYETFAPEIFLKEDIIKCDAVGGNLLSVFITYIEVPADPSGQI